MNRLEVDYDNLHGLTFILLVDGRPMHELVEDLNFGLPYHQVLEGLPNHIINPEATCVTCCDCGESGCGSSGFVITQDDELTHFHSFVTRTKTSHFNNDLKFLTKNFHEVMGKIKALAHAYAKQAGFRVIENKPILRKRS